jgi:DNA/RNA-binding domain of Phe-tRNA-synthetase-like protein
MSLPFTHAIVDDEGEIIRKYRWSNKEAKWFTENNKDAIVIKLDKPIVVKEDLFELVGECLF